MRIECKTTFLDGVHRFEAGDIRTVDAADGARFIANGWAAEVGGQPASVDAQESVTLEVQGARHITKERKHG